MTTEKTKIYVPFHPCLHVQAEYDLLKMRMTFEIQNGIPVPDFYKSKCITALNYENPVTVSAYILTYVDQEDVFEYKRVKNNKSRKMKTDRSAYIFDIEEYFLLGVGGIHLIDIIDLYSRHLYDRIESIEEKLDTIISGFRKVGSYYD